MSSYRFRRQAKVLEVAVCFALVVALAPLAAWGGDNEINCDSIFWWQSQPGDAPTSGICSNGFLCKIPQQNGAPYFRLEPGCNPNQPGGCYVDLRVPLKFPGNEQNLQTDGAPTPRVVWFAGASPPGCDPVPGAPSCPNLAKCGEFVNIDTDFIESFARIHNVTCANVGTLTQEYSIKAYQCWTSTSCREMLPVPNLKFTDPGLPEAMGCPTPRKTECGCACSEGAGNPGGGGPAAGPGTGGPSGGENDTGPGASLRYAAGGAGGDGFPGSPAWNTELGRYWSHDYAQRIVLDPVDQNDSHVWLITEKATFREFTDLVGEIYETVSPSDEYRELHRTTSGWELHDLNGTVSSFDAAGRWTSTVDRNENAKTACYDSEPACDGPGPLVKVTMHDFRIEEFAYYTSGPSTGKLMAITEVGVGGSESRTWTYTWTGEDLTEIERPDLTRLVFAYDGAHPSYLTRIDLYPNQGGPRRVLRAWEYDSVGNVSKTWAGADDFLNGVDQWSFAFDNPVSPTSATVTDPLGNDTIYTIGRDLVSNKARIEAVSSPSGCAVCGLNGDSVLAYDDPAHPLQPTQVIDGVGNVTTYSYAANGRVLTRTEALNDPQFTRMTRWEYDANYPGFVTLIEQPSVSGSGFRLTELQYDPVNGDLMSTQVTGVETTFVPEWPPNPPPAAGTFDLTTTYTYNSAGQPETIDPPGYEDPGLLDVTTYEYEDPVRGDQFPSARIDPIIGSGLFEYDAFNRRSLVTDPNGLRTETRYDEMGRVRYVRQLAKTSSPGGDPTQFPAEDLVTEYIYDEYGDLFRTILPRGTVVEYGHDDPAGRLTSVERKPDATTNGERTEYELNGAGNRTFEHLLRWTGSTYAEDSVIENVYSVRCHPDAVIRGSGSAVPSTTAYVYDCNGRLSESTDANHVGAGPTSTFEYDPLNRLKKLTQPWSEGPPDAVTHYGYDVQDHLTSVIDAEQNATSYAYSDRDLLTSELSGVSGTTSHRYNEHASLRSTTDARPVTVTRTVDALDRVLAVDFADNSLDIAYTYDDPAVPDSIGRLTRIDRNGGAGGSVSFEYDQFGRTKRDGQLEYEYDENGNRTRVANPQTVIGATWAAKYTYDFADRPSTLSFQVNANPPQAVVNSADYQAFGPLRTLSLANGTTETHSFDPRYFPDRITVTGPSSTLLDWDYTVDEVSNPKEIADLVTPTDSRSFTYRDYQYFLTCAAGPWNVAGATCTPLVGQPLQWTYDKIGNRLTETRAGATTSYVYASNGTGNTPKLQTVGLDIYAYDAVGHLTQVQTQGSYWFDYAYNQEGRLSQIKRGKPSMVNLTYDGRGFLRQGDRTPSMTESYQIYPTYSSDGRLMSWKKIDSAYVYISWDTAVLYFGARPVARVVEGAFQAQTLTFVATDHLGTPILVTDQPSAGVVWQGGFEPFGADYNGAATAGIDLRFPGQIDDDRWSFGLLSYNVHRWYEPKTGRYARPDALDLREGASLFAYGEGNPLNVIDQLGLAPCRCSDDCPGGEWTSLAGGYSYSGVIGPSNTAGFVSCDSNPNAKLWYRSECWLVGAIGGIGAGVEFTTGLGPSFCGCRVADLLGVSHQIVVSGGPATGAIGLCDQSARGRRFTFTLSIAKSIGGGIAWQRCRTKRIFAP